MCHADIQEIVRPVDAMRPIDLINPVILSALKGDEIGELVWPGPYKIEHRHAV